MRYRSRARRWPVGSCRSRGLRPLADVGPVGPTVRASGGRATPRPPRAGPQRPWRVIATRSGGARHGRTRARPSPTPESSVREPRLHPDGSRAAVRPHMGPTRRRSTPSLRHPSPRAGERPVQPCSRRAPGCVRPHRVRRRAAAPRRHCRDPSTTWSPTRSRTAPRRSSSSTSTDSDRACRLRSTGSSTTISRRASRPTIARCAPGPRTSTDGRGPTRDSRCGLRQAAHNPPVRPAADAHRRPLVAPRRGAEPAPCTVGSHHAIAPPANLASIGEAHVGSARGAKVPLTDEDPTPLARAGVRRRTGNLSRRRIRPRGPLKNGARPGGTLYGTKRSTFGTGRQRAYAEDQTPDRVPTIEPDAAFDRVL